jgi:hypothetical protein
MCANSMILAIHFDVFMFHTSISAKFVKIQRDCAPRRTLKSSMIIIIATKELEDRAKMKRRCGSICIPRNRVLGHGMLMSVI